ERERGKRKFLATNGLVSPLRLSDRFHGHLSPPSVPSVQSMEASGAQAASIPGQATSKLGPYQVGPSHLPYPVSGFRFLVSGFEWLTASANQRTHHHPDAE